MRDIAHRIARPWRDAARPARLLLAAKTALAVGIAWAIAPHMPGVADDYPYYAPLGALVSMHPTLMASARTGAQTLLGLATGIVLAAVVVVSVGPTWWSIPAVVGAGVLLSGTGWFGAAREYVPMAALFVLIIGGPDADDYSLGYLVQMAVGVLVGLVVNVVIAPATTSAAAAARIDGFQRRLAAHLDDVGDALEETWPPEHSSWADDAEGLSRTAGDIRRALDEADESRRGNPRALFRRRDVEKDHRRLDDLDMIAHHIRDMSGALADAIWARPGSVGFDPELSAPLSRACHAMAAALASRIDEPDREHQRAAEAAHAVRVLVEEVDRRSVATERAVGPGVLTAMHLRRILLVLTRGGTS